MKDILSFNKRYEKCIVTLLEVYTHTDFSGLGLGITRLGIYFGLGFEARIRIRALGIVDIYITGDSNVYRKNSKIFGNQTLGGCF